MKGRLSRRALFAALAAMAGLPACRSRGLRLWRPDVGERYPVVEYPDLAYCRGPRADTDMHRLDVYLPRGLSGCPLLLLVHGGAWMFGDNRCCGLYSSVAEFLAGQGIGVAVPRYRLAPDHRHPAQIGDIARAFAWLRRHAAELGGDPQRLFLAGHSAGGHLVALLACDDSYLRAEGVPGDAVRGVIAVSGVYRIPDGPLDVRLGGSSPQAFRLDELLPLRGFLPFQLGQVGPGIPLSVNAFGPVFGEDAATRAAASPIHHVRPGLPPFLILYAQRELPWLAAMAVEFHRALCEHGCDARLEAIAQRNHHSILFAAVRRTDPVAAAMLAFIARH